MFLLELLIFILVERVSARWDGPGRFADEGTVNTWQHRHLINMTENLCKDAYYKLRQSDLVQTGYKHTIGYELGLLASGIMEKFKHMIRVYRYYSNPRMFKDHKHTIDQIVNAYSVMQSDYNEMINEIVLYYQVLSEHRIQQAAQYQKARLYAKKHKMPLKSVLDLMSKGIDIEELDNKPMFRRSMRPPRFDEEMLEELEIQEELERAGNKTQGLGGSRRYGKNLFAKKNSSTEEAEYKRKLRYITWAEKWDGYNPATEGVHIDESIAKFGLNESDFLLMN